MKITDRKFFTCSAEELAPKLLGKIICHRVGKGTPNEFVIKTRIKVTEAYLSDDVVLDDNRSKKATSQNKMGGCLYYNYKKPDGRKRMDIVAGVEGISESVLIAETDLYEGPQTTLWALDISNPEIDGLDMLSTDSPIWIEDDGTVVIDIKTEPRKNVPDPRPLRFVAKSFIFK